MTSLIAWVSIDQRAPSAFYLASDSRISWGSERARWDAGRKLFICRQYADVFGYCGDVVFPSLVLGQIADAADAGLLFHNKDDADRRHAKFSTAVKASFGRFHRGRELGVSSVGVILIVKEQSSLGRISDLSEHQARKYNVAAISKYIGVLAANE